MQQCLARSRGSNNVTGLGGSPWLTPLSSTSHLSRLRQDLPAACRGGSQRSAETKRAGVGLGLSSKGGQEVFLRHRNVLKTGVTVTVAC